MATPAGALRSRIIESPVVRQLLGNDLEKRLRPHTTPEEIGPPYVVYEDSRDPRSDQIDGGLYSGRIIYTVIGTTYGNAQKIADAITDQLLPVDDQGDDEGWRGEQEGVFFSGVFDDSADDDYEPPVNAEEFGDFLILAAFKYWVQKPLPSA